ncbi:MAG: tetratricopeptide repeat protein [Candidatus Roizmanbacteria bacterium]
MKTEKMKNEASELFKANSFQEALAKFTECLSLDHLNRQYNSTILFNRAIVYCRISQNTEALADLSEAIKLNEDYTKAYIKRGDIYLALS